MSRFSLRVIFLFLLSAGLSLANDHLGDNLAKCGMSFKPINLEKTKNWKKLGLKNNTVSQLRPITSDISYMIGGKKHQIKAVPDTLLKMLPKIGSWMTVNTGSYNQKNLPKNIAAAWVYWLGDKNYRIEGFAQPSHYTIEPINTVFIVKGYGNANQANKHMVDSLNKLGYLDFDSANHSGGYGIYFNNKLYSQVEGSPNNKSDVKKMPLTFNYNVKDLYSDHLRLLGPYETKSNDNGNVYIYGASVSRESLWFKTEHIDCGNLYVSFNNAQQTMLGRFFTVLSKTKVYAGKLDNFVKYKDYKDASSTGDYQQINNSFVSVYVIEK